MGYSGHHRLMGLIAKVLVSEGFSVLVSTGGIIADFYGEGITTQDFVNSNEVLAGANLMVFNGSALSMYQAIVYEVPMIAIPKNISQSFYADVIENNRISKLSIYHSRITSY